MKRGGNLSRTAITRDPQRTAEWVQASRTPIVRTSGLPAASARRLEAAGAGIVKGAARKESGFSRKVRLAVRKRAGGGHAEDALCEACGKRLGRYDGEVQHRASRGSGGCTDAVVNGMANAVLLCGHGAAHVRDGCHGKCENRDPHMGMGAGGFWIKHGTTPEFDPRNVAIMLHDAGGGTTVYLAADGVGEHGTGYLLRPPAEVAA